MNDEPRPKPIRVPDTRLTEELRQIVREGIEEQRRLLEKLRRKMN